MSLYQRAFALSFLLAAFGTHTRAQTLTLAPPAQVVVLKNGRILHGSVTRVGEDYLVKTNPQSEIRLAGSLVEFAARDLKDAYATKRFLMNRSRAGEHIELAEWCMQYNLLQEAAHHILEASTIEPDSRRLPGLQRRWSVLNHIETQPKKQVVVASTTTNADANDESVASLDPDVIQQFTTTIQPILLNNCGASGCHGRNPKSEFHLQRPSWGPAITRAFTERNLKNTIGEVDRDSPKESPLLTKAISAHATLPRAIFNESKAGQLKLLTSWVERVAGADAPLPTTIVDTPSTLSQTKPMAVQPASIEQPVVKPKAKSDVVPTVPSSLFGVDDNTAPPKPLPPLTSSADHGEEPALPRDPFDPEIFNRRYSKRPPAQQ